MDNALIQLGDTDDSQKGRPFKSRFIQAGIAGYPKQFGNVLITKESLDKFVYSLINKPVIINHKDKISKDDEVGKVEQVWFNPEDGWFWCAGYLTDETAINLIRDKHWSVSCSYDVLLMDDEGGTENNIKYDKEFLNGVFTHLAIVENPRYERANIVVNSKTEIINNDRWITVHPNGEDEKGRHLLIQDGEDLKEAMQRQWGVYDKRQAKLKSDEKSHEGTAKQEPKQEEKQKLSIKDNEAVKRGLSEQTAQKQIDKLKEGKEYRINKAARTTFTGKFDDEGMPIFKDYKGNEQSYSLTNVFEEITDEPKQETKQSDSPFGEGVEIKEHDKKGYMLDSKNLKSFQKGEKFAILDDWSYDDKERYTVSFHDGKKRLGSKTYSTKRGMEKAIREHLQGGANKETKALETKTSLEEKETAYKDVLKKYHEAERMRWKEGISDADYHKTWTDYEKYKKELTTARREYAESIMSNFEEVEDNPYEERQEARRERYEELSEKAGKESEAVYKQSHDMISAIPMGQPILIGHHSEKRDRAYRQKAWDKLEMSFELSKKSDYYAGKAASVGTAGISADDANAIAKLAQKYKSGVTSAEKRRIIDRVIDIHQNAKRAADTTAQTDYSDLGFQVERNAEMNRLQLKFNGKPDEKTRSILKSNGFRWSPTQGAWQRQLNGNSEYGLKRVVEGLKKVDNSLTKGIYKIFNNYIPSIDDIPLLQGLIDIFENK